MKISQAIKKLNEDYETLDRIDGEAIIDPTTAKAKKEAEEGKENIEKVMEETTPEEIKDPKMPKTKDLKAMGLQEAFDEESLNEARDDVTPLLKRNLLRAKRNIATDEDLKLREDIDDEVVTFPEDDTGEWDISSTNDLELFADSPGYYKTLAKLQLRNFGKIYYWTNKLEPLEVEDVIDFVLEEE